MRVLAGCITRISVCSVGADAATKAVVTDPPSLGGNAIMRCCVFARTSVPGTNLKKIVFPLVSGGQNQLPGLSPSTGPSPMSAHRRSARNSTGLERGGGGNTAEFNHLRRRSGFVPVRALLLLPDWRIGHEVNPGGSSPNRLIPHVVARAQHGVYTCRAHSRPLLRLNLNDTRALDVFRNTSLLACYNPIARCRR